MYPLWRIEDPEPEPSSQYERQARTGAWGSQAQVWGKWEYLSGGEGRK